MGEEPLVFRQPPSNNVINNDETPTNVEIKADVVLVLLLVAVMIISNTIGAQLIVLPLQMDMTLRYRNDWLTIVGQVLAASEVDSLKYDWFSFPSWMIMIS